MSNQNISVLTLGVVAAVALSRGRFVTGAGAYPTAGGRACRVTQWDGAIGDRVPTDVLGTAVVEAGAAIATDTLVEVLADGRVVTQTTGVAVGRTLEPAIGAGAFIEILLIPN